MAAKYLRKACCIALIVTAWVNAAEPPPDLAKKVAAREALSETERSQYTYKQTFVVQELTEKGGIAGEYKEQREVIFSPDGQRTEQLIGHPISTMKRLKMTVEDFRDLREIQPLLLSPDRLFQYETLTKGEEEIDGVQCWVLRVRPRQLLSGMRYFDGLFWVDQRDYSIIRSEGRAVPQIYSTKANKENLFPAFTTVRQKVGDFWFPVLTSGDDTLHFSSGPIREKLTVRYREYRKFGAESKVIPEP